MTFWPDLSKRSNEPELMDAPDSDRQFFFKSLEHLGIVNLLFTPCRRLMKSYFLSVMRREPKRKWKLLDIGAGGCDVPIWFVQRCRRHGLEVEFTCLDYDSRAIEFAEKKCRDYPNIEIVQANALELRELDRQWDFVFTNHFLHHLTDEEIVRALEAIHAVCTYQYVLSDIHRLRSSYLTFSAFATIWIHNSFSYYDGRMSIRKGFTTKEFEILVDQAGLTKKATVHRSFPAHLAIVSNVRSR